MEVRSLSSRFQTRFTDSPALGDKCMYRHALPPGFVLKSEKKAAEELAKREQISLEDFLEVEVSFNHTLLRCALMGCIL